MTYQEFLNEWRGASDSIECMTSGSTGKPKRILLPKREVERSARRTIDFFGLGGESILYSCISPDYIGGKMMAVRAELCGGTLKWETPSNTPLRGHDGAVTDLLAVVPSQMRHILDRPELFRSLRHIIIGGSAIPPGLRKRIASSGLDAWETYGMTETASHVALRKVSAEETGFVPLDGITVGLEEDGRLRIDIKGWTTVVTNDIARVHADGSFSIIGRADNVIVTGGKKVHPEELEMLIEREFGFPALVASLPDEKWGEKVILVTEDRGKTPDESILRYCRKEMPPHCVPKQIIHNDICRTASGKKCRDKERIRKAYGNISD